jgi:DDE superfamily endonuclease
MPSPSTPLNRNHRYKTSLDWAAQMVSVVSRWLKRSWICVADGAYGNAKFGWACRCHGVTLVSRLPWKANLYDFAPVAPSRRQRGRPRTKGALLPSMQQQFERLSHPNLLSDRLPPIVSSRFQILRWYGGTHALRQLVTGTAVWAVDGYRPFTFAVGVGGRSDGATTACCFILY